MKRGPNDGILSIIKKVNVGDILAFHCNSEGGSKLLGFAEYVRYYDQVDEPLVNVECFTNEQLGWIGDGGWTIQLHYKNLYNTREQNITIRYQCAGIISNYNKILENQIGKDKKSWFCSGVNNDKDFCLRDHYDLFVKYSETLPDKVT